MKGSDFVLLLAAIPARIPDREQAILDAVANDEQIDWPMIEVAVSYNGHAGVISVAADYLAIGEPDDFVRVPVSPLATQRIVDHLGAILPTPKLVDLIWRAATVKLAPQPWGPPYDASMLSVDRFAKQSARIEDSRKGRTGLVAGHKKDLVLSERLAARPTQVAIYGWHQLNGQAIQPLSLVHENTYADYSHGIRLVAATMTVDGTEMSVEAVLRSRDLAGLLSNEGPLTVVRQPGVAAPAAAVAARITAGATHPADAPPAPDRSLADRALEVAQHELDRGVQEQPLGSKTGPDIKAYFAGCQRGGRPLGLTTGNWCAAFASYCAFQAAAPGETPPHGYRAAVAELWADALASGAAKPATSNYIPRVGDLAIYARGLADPTKGGIGHVGRLLVPPDATGAYSNIEGNHDNRVARVARQRGEAVGWIAYPATDAAEPVVDEGSLVEAADIRSKAPASDG